MNMWMHVHGIKTRKHKTNPNLNMWKSKRITSMWNRIFKPKIYGKRIQDRSIACEIRNKIRKIRVFEKDHAHAWTSLRAHNQACIRGQDYAHVGFGPETLATQKLKQSFKTINLISEHASNINLNNLNYGQIYQR